MTLPRLSLTVACAALAFGLFGCSDVDSTNLKTDGIRADLYAVVDGSGATEARAILQVDGSNFTYVTLKDGDRITATVAGDTKEMSESNLFGVVEYDAYFVGQDQEGTTVDFDLERASDTSATDNSATIPAPFTLTAPSGSGLSYSRASDDIVVTYDNSGKSDVMSYSLDGDCIDSVTQTVSGDTGTFTIPKGSMAKRADATTDSCSIDVAVFRTRKGTLDSDFAGGGAYGRQLRRFSFTSTP